jgi:predicted ester cyclase
LPTIRGIEVMPCRQITMSLDEHKRIALESFRIIESGDAASADLIIAPGFVNREAEDDPEQADRSARGPGGFLATSHWLRTAFTELRFERFETLAEDERVAVLATMTGRHTGEFQGIPPTNKRFQQRQVHFFRLRAGQIVEHLAQRDDLGLLLQLGWCSRHEG